MCGFITPPSGPFSKAAKGRQYYDLEKKYERYTGCLHEAGHVVFARRLGIAFNGVCIREVDGYVTMEMMGLRIKPPVSRENALIVAAAGGAITYLTIIHGDPSDRFATDEQDMDFALGTTDGDRQCFAREQDVLYSNKMRDEFEMSSRKIAKQVESDQALASEIETVADFLFQEWTTNRQEIVTTGEWHEVPASVIP